MKNLILPFIVLSLALSACKKDPDNWPDAELDDSPGIDEYVHFVMGTDTLIFEEDNQIAAVLVSTSGSQKLSLSCNIPESSQWVLLFPYTNATTYTLDLSNAAVQFQFTNSLVALKNISGSGTIHVSQTTQQSKTYDVYNGSINLNMRDIISNDTLAGQASFNIARVL